MTDMASPAYWWPIQGEWVEPPNNDRGGSSGVQRVRADDGKLYYVKRQSNYLYRSLLHPFGRPTLLREYRNMKRLAVLGVPTSIPVCFDMLRRNGQWHALLVTLALDSYVSLQAGFADQRWQPDRRRAVLDAVMQMLLRLHRSRRKHGHLYPKEVFVDDSQSVPRTALVDLELCRHRLTRAQAATSDLRRLLRSLGEMGLTELEYQHAITLYAAAGIRLPQDFKQQCRLEQAAAA
jgi:hypothetical protein